LFHQIILYISFIADLQQLLIHVPKNKKKKAIELLHQIEQQPSELTFDSSGAILIDGVGIPASNIFLLFPLLFKKDKVLLPGHSEFVNKLKEMKLQHLISNESSRKKKDEMKIGGTSSENVLNKYWYYLGP
jgi:hypothetical protein